MSYMVSVIVPVYNGEQYVLSCCEMLQKQTIGTVEIVFVNDGSTDNSAKIIDECALKYENVKSIHQKNKGVSVARNVGIEAATGDYIGFVDVDDQIDDDMYEVLYCHITKNNLDLISMERVGQPGELKIYDNKLDCVGSLLHTEMNMSVCNKLIRKSLFHTSVFPEGKRIHEDLFATYTMLKRSERVGIINIDKYHYIQREGSSSRALVFNEKYFDAIDIADLIYQDMNDNYSELSVYNEARKANTYLRISKIYYLRKAPKEFRPRIKAMRIYLQSLDKSMLDIYFKKTNKIRYYLYIYAFPLFLLLIKTIDKK